MTTSSTRPFDPLFVIIVFVTVCLCISCGYQFRADGEPVGIEIESIAIPMMTSSSSVIGFEADFTGIIREEFISHAKLPIVPSDQASTVLTGRISEIRAEPLTYSLHEYDSGGRTMSHVTTSSRRLKIRLDVSLTDKRSGRLIWHDSSMEEEARYDVGTDPLANRYSQEQALKKIARLMAKRIYMKTMERF
ncbi:MAG: hypothetical protein JRJ06_00910 [Deltaproteobacteria bacterium]|nr:hypothetical protein [Deltaproteobacteria bacterium]MBW1911759.1 hypothetical protein [Deltaproteobacteria bacterium]